MPERQRPHEPTIEWMVSDIAARCRAALQSLDSPDAASARLDDAASMLRSAADDLASLLGLVDEPVRSASRRSNDDTQTAFGVSFGAARQPVSDG